MSAVDYALHGSKRGGIAREALDAWRGITWVQVKGAFLFGCALWAYHLVVFANPIFAELERLPLWLGIGFLKAQLGASVLLLALVATDRITGNDPRHRAAYAAAVVVTATLYALLLALIELRSDFTWIEFVKSSFYFFFEWLVLGGIATFIYTDRRRARAARARMHAAEIERAQAAKRTLESRLQAMQARVEPQFLFNTLAQVRDLYRASAERGERMLDELIAYLRAAMPKMRDTSSTVGQELELVRAYLGIVRLRLGERLAFDIEPPGEIADARMPPMMMLPLVDHAIVHGLADPTASGSMHVRAGLADQRLRLEIADTGAGLRPESEDLGIAGIRERLAALYGGDASLTLRRTGPRATQAVLELRYEPVEPLAAP
ncbi:MAG TPA: histidine kinase [Casimicrobiaceae bacterium]|nr:histidine kinase [Casimicrobiaceae bacterium]